MKKVFLCFILLLSVSSWANFEAPKVLDAQIVDGKMVVDFEHERAIRPFAFLQFPVKHVWNKMIECPNNSKGDTTAKINVTLSVKNKNFEIESTVRDTRKVKFDFTKFCKGSTITHMIVNGTELALQ